MRSYRVLVLGPGGSGKTVLLGSMYKRLAIVQPSTNFFLDTTPDREQRLQEIADIIINSPRWPEPTTRADFSEWDFYCCVTSAGGVRRIIRVRYTDYAGGNLEGFQDPNFTKALHKAHAFLGLIDGRKLLLWLRGEDHSFLDSTMHGVLATIQDYPKKPFQFVITKWDLIQQDYSLQQVRSALMRHPWFAGIVANHGILNEGRGVLRLIPTSAVGNGFAELHGNQMIKRPARLYSPLNVEIPLVSVLPDMYQTRYGELADSTRQNLRRRAEVDEPLSDLQPYVRYLSQVISWLQSLFSFSLFGVPGLPAPDPELLARVITAFQGRVHRRAMAGRMTAQTAPELVSRFFTILGDFERSYPGSVLNARR